MAKARAQTAKDMLGLTDLRGDHLQGNTDPDIDPTNRDLDTFLNNKDAWPGGAPVETQMQDRAGL